MVYTIEGLAMVSLSFVLFPFVTTEQHHRGLIPAATGVHDE